MAAEPLTPASFQDALRGGRNGHGGFAAASRVWRGSVPRMSRLVAPAFIIAIGLGWLLTVRQVIPGVNWMWILLLATAGILILVVRRLTRTSLLIGPFLILCAVSSYLRQRGSLPADIEVPSLIIALGVLLLLARFAPLPERGGPSRD